MAVNARWQLTLSTVLAWSAALALALVAGFAFSGQGIVGLRLAPGLEIGALLLTPRARWRALVPAFALVHAVVMARYGDAMPLAIGSGVSAALLSLAAAHLLQRDGTWLEGRADDLAAWARFAVIAIVLVPAVDALWGLFLVLTAASAPPAAGAPAIFGAWWLGDALGAAILVPALLRLAPAALARWRPDRAGEALAALAGFAALAAAVAGQGAVLPVLVLPLALIALAFRHGSAGLAAGTAIATLLVLGFTLAGRGPFAAMAVGAPAAVALAQAFLLSAFAAALVVAALGDERRRLQHRDAIAAEIYELVAAQSGDMMFVIRSDGSGRFVSPAAADLLGVPAAALAGIDWCGRIHPNDKAGYETAVAAIAAGEASAGCILRVRDAEGGHRWLDVRLKPSRTAARDGTPLIVGTARDITLRWLREQQLEAVATTDALTGLPNRHKFSELRRAAWQHAARTGQALSLMIVDLDHFKAYNDTYGHAEGDRCLAAVARLIDATVARTDDICARFGGEEFVAILPDTPSDGALRVGERICRAVRAAGLPNAAGPKGVVTVSVGIATIVPVGDDAGVLFEAADAALYRAKANGRDQAHVTDLDDVAPRRAALAG
ncbi:bifunctional diguanylate cyclase/phosphodiesterase [Labrys wisconsinensis]|uniref:diguanylate cyclase n=1 Tax=Labrys wisconsinensis TaxID=425677 RepID=A0ABU0JBW3_9HYPH|nr:diguanylate cyclase [Labrys wisconsinensis]MDQ0471772.1 diguanylate cyclase (GGDEF)-like protein/PAS domain S-box-containing protein [Labrys wisconsinensis]